MQGSKIAAREYIIDSGQIWLTITEEEEGNGDESDKYR